MWKPEHRRSLDRRGLRYPSDLTDEEWALVAPLIRPAKRGGRPRSVDVREILNAIFYVLSTDCQWNAIPTDLPPRSTVWDYLDLWEWDGTIERIHHTLDVLAADIQDRDGAETLLRQARKRFPFIERIIGDGGYQGPKMQAVVARTSAWTIDIVKRSDLRRFVVTGPH